MPAAKARLHSVKTFSLHRSMLETESNRLLLQVLAAEGRAADAATTSPTAIETASLQVNKTL